MVGKLTSHLRGFQSFSKCKRVVGFHYCTLLLIAAMPFVGGIGTTGEAATYYLAPTGADSNAGTSSSAPWKTFKFALPKLKPGDTLVLRNGTYTSATTGYPLIQCGKNAAHGTASQRITLKAEHERQAFLKGDGSAYPLYMIGCAYWSIQGLRIEGGDFKNSPLTNGHTVFINNAKFITFQRNLVRFNNRYKNGSIVAFGGTTNALIEENEVYSYHRNGMGGGNQNTYRRNYIHSRGHADLSDGYASFAPSQGDSGYIFYPSSHNVVENNISEGNDRGYDLQAMGSTQNNRFYGNISLQDRYGALVTARGSGTENMPHDNVFIHFLVMQYKAVGLFSRSAEGTQCQQCSFLSGGSGQNGLAVDAPSSYPGDGYYSFFATNVLAWQHSGSGVMVASRINQWTIDEVNSYAGKPNYTPTSSGNLKNTQAVDPQLGACRVFIPASSPMKGAGKNGADIGATVLYRYQNGGLTTQPLWEPGSGKFPCGAIIPGVNDLAGASCFDVHKRLNVQANGCSLPSNYKQLSVAAVTPHNLRIIGAD
jgi:hypothetical protein